MTIRAKALLFDNDGVLVDSHQLVMEAWQTLSAEFELDFEELRTKLVGVRAIETLTRYLTGDALDEALRRIDEIEIETASRTKPINGAIDLLASLPDNVWAVVTSANADLAVARWIGAQIPLPPVVVTAEHVSNGKPHAEPFLLGAQRCGVDPHDCVVFEDSPAGGVSAAAAGAAVVAVGDQAWTVEPFARIKDLSRVTVTKDAEGLLVDFR